MTMTSSEANDFAFLSGGAGAIPASIVKAICAVMTTVEAVKKSQKNQHGGWMFSSTDDIYAALTRKLGEVGLAIITLESEIDIVEGKEKDGKASRWLKATYNFILATETDIWEHQLAKRTVMTPISGPQTFQAAQSYCEKAFLRSVFKLPTGDVDLDAMPEDFEYASVLSKRNVPPPPPPPKTGQTTGHAEEPGDRIVWDGE